MPSARERHGFGVRGERRNRRRWTGRAADVTFRALEAYDAAMKVERHID
jgi:hypothetical protein